VTVVPRNGEVGHPLTFLPLSFDSFVRISSVFMIRVRVGVWDGHCFSFPESISGFRVRFCHENEPSIFL